MTQEEMQQLRMQMAPMFNVGSVDREVVVGLLEHIDQLEDALKDMVGLFTALNEFMETHSGRKNDKLTGYLDKAHKALGDK